MRGRPGLFHVQVLAEQPYLGRLPIWTVMTQWMDEIAARRTLRNYPRGYSRVVSYEDWRDHMRKTRGPNWWRTS